MDTSIPFWQSKSLDQMSDEEWESLCDACGRCCMVKLLDEDNGDIFATTVACRLLDTQTCRCTNYTNRKAMVSDCLRLRPLTEQILRILPNSCAYKRLHQGQGLAAWHPLISGDPQTVIDAGISVKDQVISEQYIHPDDLEDYIIEM